MKITVLDYSNADPLICAECNQVSSDTNEPRYEDFEECDECKRIICGRCITIGYVSNRRQCVKCDKREMTRAAATKRIEI